jgi:hypothetical protein
VSLLVSERIRAGVDRVPELRVTSVGDVALEGKESPTELYAVQRAPVGI